MITGAEYQKQRLEYLIKKQRIPINIAIVLQSIMLLFISYLCLDIIVNIKALSSILITGVLTIVIIGILITLLIVSIKKPIVGLLTGIVIIYISFTGPFVIFSLLDDTRSSLLFTTTIIILLILFPQAFGLASAIKQKKYRMQLNSLS